MLKYRNDRPEIHPDGGIVPENGPRWQRQRGLFQQRMLSRSKVSCYASKIDETTLEVLRDVEKSFGHEKELATSDFQRVLNN